MRIITLILCALSLVAQDDAEKKNKVSYSIGHQIGSNFTSQGIDLDLDQLIAGLKDGMSGTSAMPEEEMMQVLNAFQTEMRDKQRAKMQEQSQANAKHAMTFLEENKAKEDVVTLESGLQYKVLTKGSGESPKATDKVRVHYAGRLMDGSEFDSSIKRGEPAEFPVNGVIKGWTEALQLMKPGSKWELYIPPALGYGTRGAGQKIPPNSVLIFEVELLAVNP